MSKRRVPLLTINSIAASLSKVCSSSANPSVSIKNLGTAAQRSELSNSPGSHLDNSDDHFQNPSGSYAQTQNPIDFLQKIDGNGLNPNWGFRETSGNAVGSNQVSQIGSYGGSNSQNHGDYQDFSRSYRESRSVHQNNSADRNGNLWEYDMKANGQFQNNGREVKSPNSSSSFQDHPNGVYGRNENYQGHSESQGSWNSNYARNHNHYQSGSNAYYAGNVGHSQQNVNAGQHISNLNDIQNMREASHESNISNVEGTLAESSSESIPYKGTLDEIDELCKEKKVKEAVEVLQMLEEQRVPVDLHRFLQLMDACGETKDLEQAKAVHDHIVRSQSPLGVRMSNKILEMYGKCGDMGSAFAVFNKMPEHNLTSWDNMISWLAKNGLGEDAIDLFSQFKQAGLVPDAQFFLGVFSACGVLGDVNEGMLHFETMRKDYGIVPSMEHFTSIVNMLGTSGYLNEAFEFIEKMPMEPSVDVWETLMNLSRVHGNTELGDRCAELVELLDPSRLNGQSKAGLLPIKVSDLAKEKEKKLASQNLLEIRSRVHEYRAGDTSHPETDRIYAMLKGLASQMKEHGHIPETRFVLHDVDQECKEEALLAHSERLAAAYGLLTSPARAPIRVIKNLRVCGDCHNALKIISKIVGRELIMRDAKRFHHFKDGVCSCRDYW